MLREEATKDFLTGAYNRRYFFEELKREIKKYDRYRSPFSLMMIDIDNFKKFNDTFGHLRGDWLLKETVEIFNNSIREDIDLVVRYGGDEFVIILINTNQVEAEQVAERIIDKFDNKNMEMASLSIGICEYEKKMGSENLINSADALMYEAKIEEGSSIKIVL